jgi:hypothetical protein
LLLENKTQEEIARELHISTRTVARYSQRIEKRYGKMQRQKTDSTLFMEYEIFKNRMLSLYRGLENVVTSPDEEVSGKDRARCAEVAASIAYDLLKLESDSIKAIKELISIENKNTLINNLRNRHSSNNIIENDIGYENESIQEEQEYNPNRKF